MKKQREPRLLSNRFKPIKELHNSKRLCEQTGIDKIYSVIEEECCRGYRLTDKVCGLPYICKADVEETNNDIFIVRFRLREEEEYELNRVVELSNYRFLSKKHLIYKKKVEYGLPFLDCVWVIQKNELLNEIGDEEFYQRRNFIGAYLNMSNCATNWDNFFRSNCNGKTIVDVAKFLNYSEENILFLQCGEKDRNAKINIAKKFPTTIKFLNCPDTKGRIGSNRTVLEYAKDLIAGWIGEDLFCLTLRNNGIDIELNGADKDRTIVPKKKVDTKPDIAMRYKNGEWRECELMMEHTGFPSEKGIIVLRHYKFNNLVEKKCLFIDLDFKTGKYVIIDFRKGKPNAKFVEHYENWGGKPAYIISFDDNAIKMREHSLIITDIKNILAPPKVLEASPKTHELFYDTTIVDKNNIVDKIYQKVKEERTTISIDESKEIPLTNAKNTEIGNYDSCDDLDESSSDEDISSWENSHPELDGWV